MTIPKPIRVERGAGGEESLAEAAKALAGAKFPVIVAGGGVIMSDGQAEAVRLAEHLSAPGGHQLSAQRCLPGEPSADVRARWAIRAPRRR